MKIDSFLILALMLFNAVMIRFVFQPGGVLVDLNSINRFHFDYGNMLSIIEVMIYLHVAFLFLYVISYGGRLIGLDIYFDKIALWSTRCGYTVWFLLLLLILRNFSFAFPW